MSTVNPNGDAHIRSIAPSLEAFDAVLRLKRRLMECTADVQDVAASMLMNLTIDVLPADVACWCFDASGEVFTEMAHRGMALVFANEMETIRAAGDAVMEMLP